jgi:hypothetical protein
MSKDSAGNTSRCKLLYYLAERKLMSVLMKQASMNGFSVCIILAHWCKLGTHNSRPDDPSCAHNTPHMKHPILSIHLAAYTIHQAVSIN